MFFSQLIHDLKSWVSALHPALRLAVLAALSALIYWLAFTNPANLFSLYGRTGADGYYLQDGEPWKLLSLILAFTVLLVIYLAAWRIARQARGRAAVAAVFAGFLAFSAVLLFMQPFDSVDIYDYIIHGRMTAFYHTNPFLGTPNMFPRDPFYNYAAWKQEPSAYGPIWELLAAPAARLAGNGIVANVIVYKMIPGLFLLASLGLIALILRRQAPKETLAGVLLLGWNPVVLYEVLGNGHNDMVMVFWILAAVWAIQRRRYTTSILALVAGTLVKFIPILLIPAAGFIALFELREGRERLSFLLRTALGSILTVVLLYAPFWQGPQVLTLTHRTNLFTSSLPASLYHILSPRLGDATAAHMIDLGALGLTLVVAIWVGWRAGRSPSPDRFAQASFSILAFYLLVTCLWFQQWYMVWLVALTPLLLTASFRALGLFSAFWALSKQFIFGPLLIWPQHRLAQPWLEIWFTLFVLGASWLYALYAIEAARKMQPIAHSSPARQTNPAAQPMRSPAPFWRSARGMLQTVTQLFINLLGGS